MLTPAELRSRLQNVLAFPVTPFNADLSLDLDGFRANVRFLADAGLTGLVAAGGTGELYSLEPGECVALYRAAVEEVGNRLTVVAGVGINVRMGAQLAAEAEAAGCHAVLILPPAYGACEQDGLFSYYQAIASATRLGVFPYARGQAVLSPRLVERLAGVPNVVAFKDGHGDLRLWQAIRERVGDRLTWLGGMGDDLVVPYFAAGAQGFTSSVANYDPSTALALFAAVSKGDYAEADRLLRERGVYAAYEMRSRKRGHEVSVVKAAMQLAGRPAGPVRPPLLPLTADERAELQGIVSQRLPVAAGR
jgi:5-dehydro-4-deoxyglucarate dehydratase